MPLTGTDSPLCTGLLHKVTLYSDINLMTPNNVAIVFAPNILRPPNENVSLALLDCASSNNLVRCMIEEYDLIFGEVPSTLLYALPDDALTHPHVIVIIIIIVRVRSRPRHQSPCPSWRRLSLRSGQKTSWHPPCWRPHRWCVVIIILHVLLVGT
jgi:hypothetical protein